MPITQESYQRALLTLQKGISITEANYLRKLASEVPRGCIIEVGSLHGKSAVALAMGAIENSHGYTPEIYCIEPHRHFTGHYGGVFGPNDRANYYRTMLDSEAFEHVSLVGLSSEEVAHSWRRPIGLAFIDGDHRYAGVKNDIDCWHPHILPGAYVVFDDATDPNAGPSKLINELTEKKQYNHIETFGKLVVLQKLTTHATGAVRNTVPRKRILVICENLVLGGGFLRFFRAGEVLNEWGHELTFAVMSQTPSQRFSTSVNVIGIKEAFERNWEVVMIPGAGFSEPGYKFLRKLRSPNFGIRVQHVLNDQVRREAFNRVNQEFSPHVVIFNNDAWYPGSYTNFIGDRFYELIGAVDPVHYAPPAYKRLPHREGAWYVGGQTRKNPAPLLNALNYLPDNVVLKLFGPYNNDFTNAIRPFLDSGRVILTGPLVHEQMYSFYHDVDCVVMTEEFAGWANMVAEAMASGVPVICSRHGTSTIALHQRTALVLESIDAACIAQNIRQLMQNPGLCRSLASTARNEIIEKSWERYARRLLEYINFDGDSHYTHAPEYGLNGKWPLSMRLSGLEPVLKTIGGRTVADFGGAEGAVGKTLLDRGADLVHGFEYDPSRVAIANSLIGHHRLSRYWVVDLNHWDEFKDQWGGSLLRQYDVVLFLGVYHHLPASKRLDIMEKVADMAIHAFCMRTDEQYYVDDGIEMRLSELGFVRQSVQDTLAADHCGQLRIYSRHASQK